MTTACSSCHTILPPGAQACPGCKLPLFAQPVRVVPQSKPLLHPLQWLILFVAAGVGLWALADWQNSRDVKADEAHTATRNAEIDRQNAVVATVSNPDAFISKCGKPAKRYDRLLAEDRMDPADASNPTTLVYRDTSSETHVMFFKSAGGPVFKEHIAGRIYNKRDYEGLRDLGCLKGK